MSAACTSDCTIAPSSVSPETDFPVGLGMSDVNAIPATVTADAIYGDPHVLSENIPVATKGTRIFDAPASPGNPAACRPDSMAEIQHAGDTCPNC